MSQKNLFSLEDRVILVTGATGALAGEAAHYLVAQGAKVIFLSRSQDKIDAAVAEASQVSEKVSGYACDVCDQVGLKAVKEKVLAAHGQIDGLVNGAGGNMPGATISPDKTVFDLDLQDYDKVIDLNLKGTLVPSLVFGEVFASQKSGCIVNFSSASSTQVLTRVLGYSNAKAAIDNLTRWMAVDFARKYGDTVRVNAVCPGFFLGKQNKALLTNQDGSLSPRGQQIVDNTPMGRFGDAPEVCGAIHYLLSDAAKFVTGQILSVDGGFGAYSGV